MKKYRGGARSEHRARAGRRGAVGQGQDRDRDRDRDGDRDGVRQPWLRARGWGLVSSPAAFREVPELLEVVVARGGGERGAGRSGKVGSTCRLAFWGEK